MSQIGMKQPRLWQKIAKLLPQENVPGEAAALADRLIRAMDAASMLHMKRIVKTREKSQQEDSSADEANGGVLK